MQPLSITQQRVYELLIECDGNQSNVAKRMGLGSQTINKHVAAIRRKGHKIQTIPRGANRFGLPSLLRDQGAYIYNPAPGERLLGRSTLHKEIGPDGEPVLQWVKTKVDQQRAEDVYAEIIAGLQDKIPRAKPVAAPSRRHSPDLLNCFIVTDYHLGMKAWHEETRGQDWDTSIAERLLVDWFAAAIKAAPNAERAVFAQLGDFLHWDGMDAVTPASGNLLDADTRFQKMVRVAIRAIRQVVRLLLEKHASVHLIMAEGNHDPASSVWLRELFAAFYEDEPRVTIDLSPDPYYCLEHGDVSLFFHHGHKRKPANVDDVFVAKFRDVFGRTRHSYGHMGHWHHIEVKETNLMVVEQHRTLASSDAYASRGGWMSGRDAKCITYHQKFGEVGRVTVTPDMVRAA
jgi:biotin operon repressor